MKLKYLVMLFFISVFFACEDNEEITINPDNLLLGNWSESVYNPETETTTFKRKASLPEKKYGIAFQQNGDFIERSSGFCGTPPLVFSDFTGSFQLQEETLIKINTQFFPSSYAWRVVTISEDKLVVKREFTKQEIDHRSLMELYNELYNIAYGASCSDTSDWGFVGYGAKACGGFQGYIPYSKNIDVNAFLEKVTAYSTAEKEFNSKWGIVSDCAITPAPKSVTCNYGYPTLIY